METTSGNESPLETELRDDIAEWLAEVEPEATLVPDRDGGLLRQPLVSQGIRRRRVVYGFHPQRALDLFTAQPLVHGADERAAVSDIELAAEFYAGLAERVLG